MKSTRAAPDPLKKTAKGTVMDQHQFGLDPAANALLRELLTRVRELLGEPFVGMYLDGSLTSGDFDQDSDIDFVVVTRDEISEEVFLALQSMHDRLATADTVWAIQLEGSYLSQRALRRYDPAFTRYPNLERGAGEQLKWAEHPQTWNVHRAVLIERGIVISGPAPRSLIDPVSPTQLRQAMQPALNGWAANFLQDPAPLKSRGYQSYTVLTLCRILFTLENGAIASKPAAAQWAQANLSAHWMPLIERAWEGRHHPDGEAWPEDIIVTLELIRFARERMRGEQ